MRRVERTPRWLAVAVVAGLGAMASSASASSVVPATLAELADDARVIVYGRVASVSPRWTTGRERIESLVTVDASGYFKGDLGPSVRVRVPGGTLGAYRTVVVGAPVLTIGQEVVLFLGARGPSIPVILGLSQGVFRIVVNGSTGQRLVMPTFVPGPSVQPLVRGDVERRLMPFGEFGRRLRELVAGLPGRVVRR
ncbi:MAG: hypothetical protein QF463_00260 [Vicinamibacterales bacterium]|nr:hypothetical protein [Vicinamibacterales bacterium]MDP6607485.1 hypothetical protein [Vicinamibacterales bacterium]